MGAPKTEETGLKIKVARKRVEAEIIVERTVIIQVSFERFVGTSTGEQTDSRATWHLGILMGSTAEDFRWAPCPFYTLLRDCLSPGKPLEHETGCASTIHQLILSAVQAICQFKTSKRKGSKAGIPTKKSFSLLGRKIIKTPPSATFVEKGLCTYFFKSPKEQCCKSRTMHDAPAAYRRAERSG